MSRRAWFKDEQTTSQGLTTIEFSFLTNNTSDPATTSFRGCGGGTGSDGASSVSNSGPSAIASITRTGTGAFLVTFADGYRYATTVFSQISGADGFQAQCGLVANEGSGHTTACTVAVTVLNTSFAAADTTGRRVSVRIAFKDSGNGT